MRIAVFGLGYAGSISAASLAEDSHDVIGVDISADKVAIMNEGRSPIIEPGLDELMQRTVASGHLRATTDTEDAVRSSELSLICVGTPSRRNGTPDLTYLTRVAEDIGRSLRNSPDYHVVVIRSTVMPGTTHDHIIPALEAASGKRYGEGFGVSVNPEFLREGTALADFRKPPITLIGHNGSSDAGPTMAMYEGLDAPVCNTSIRVAEMIKCISNVWHATKIVFANEIGSMCKALAIDGHEVMDIFCRDTKLNLSARYLKPGFAFGGSCLPKEVRALQHRAKELDVDTPLVGSLLDSNRLHIQQAVNRVVDSGKTRVGMLGLSFKPGTDDLRESPLVILAETLLGKGFDLRVYDRSVSLGALVGANKTYVTERIPHLSRFLCASIDEVIAHGDVLVVGHQSPEFSDAMTRTRADQTVLDLVRLPIDPAAVPAHYDGLCW
jgi:GDP-mannose 6-dehydrogenase